MTKFETVLPAPNADILPRRCYRASEEGRKKRKERGQIKKELPEWTLKECILILL